jgi:helix-turn-helix, Psq domain
MTSTPDAQLLQKEAKILLAKQAFQKNQFLSQRKAAETYEIAESTLRGRLDGAIPKNESNARKRKLKLSEE